MACIKACTSSTTQAELHVVAGAAVKVPGQAHIHGVCEFALKPPMHGALARAWRASVSQSHDDKHS